MMMLDMDSIMIAEQLIFVSHSNYYALNPQSLSFSFIPFMPIFYILNPVILAFLISKLSHYTTFRAISFAPVRLQY